MPGEKKKVAISDQNTPPSAVPAEAGGDTRAHPPLPGGPQPGHAAASLEAFTGVTGDLPPAAGRAGVKPGSVAGCRTPPHTPSSPLELGRGSPGPGGGGEVAGGAGAGTPGWEQDP